MNASLYEPGRNCAMSSSTVWILLALFFVHIKDFQSTTITEEIKYVRQGEKMTLSCSGVKHSNVTWIKQTENSVSTVVAIGNTAANPDRHSANYSGVDGVYTFTVHNFLEASDAGKYICQMNLIFITEKEIVFTVIVPNGPSIATITGSYPVFADGNSSLILTCSATATPGVSFEWRIGESIAANSIRKDEDSTNTLILSPVEASNNGANIVCTAKNTVRSDIQASGFLLLNVHYGPNSVAITGNTPIYSDGIISVTLTCTAASSNPGVTFKWTKSGISIGDSSGTLTFTPLWTDARAEIVCIATNTQHHDQQAKDNVALTVHYGPTSVTITDNKPVNADDTNRLQLRCTAQQYSPGVAFQWKEENRNITGENSDTFSKVAHASDNGRTMSCLAWNSLYPDKSKEVSAPLTVYYGARNTTIQAEEVVHEGANMTVTCSCDSNPNPTFVITGPTPKRVANSSRLDIQNISRSDGGKYSCLAGNAYFSETKTTTVIVIYPPDVTVAYSNATNNDREVEFTCVAEGIPRRYTFGSWKHFAPDGQTLIRELHGIQNEGMFTLTLPNPVSYEDSGYYVCTVNNGVHGMAQHLDQTKMANYFIVDGAPKILESENYVNGSLGDATILNVRFYSMPDYTSVSWYILNDGLLTSIQNNVNTQAMDTLEAIFHGHSVNVPGFVTTMKIDRVTSADFASFRIVVKNAKGSAEFDKTLKETTLTTNDSSWFTTVVVALIMATVFALVAVLLSSKR